jgi:DNA-binding response OmpR family regulator
VSADRTPGSLLGNPLGNRRILVVEDELTLCDVVRGYLAQAGFQVDVAHDAFTAMHLAATREPDLILMDRMIPGLDGAEVCRRLRATTDVPLIMLTALGTEDDRIVGLEAGADDYLVKPFDFGELVARVRALQRRPRNVDAPIITRGLLRLDPVRHEIATGTAALSLTSTEYNILELLMRRSPAVVDRKAIAEHAWRDETTPLGSNAIDVQLSRLRAKITNTGVRIVTVRGAGYRLEEA